MVVRTKCRNRIFILLINTDMRKLVLVAFCFLCSCVFSFASSLDSPEDLVTFCTDDNELGINYPAGTSDEQAFWLGVGCLESTPSPQWFAMQIDQGGEMGIFISHSEEQDIDFACFGPFTGKNKMEVLDYIQKNPSVFDIASSIFDDVPEMPEDINCYEKYPDYKRTLDSLNQVLDDFYDACFDSIITNNDDWDWTLYDEVDVCYEEKVRNANIKVPDDPAMFDISNPCFRGYWDEYPRKTMVDCSYSTSSKEICYIPNAQPGEWYILLITNYSQMPGTISFNKSYGTATTNCAIIVDAYTTGPYCEGETIQLGVSNAPKDATFSWIGPNGFSSTEQNPVIPQATVEHAGSYSVVMTANNHNSPEVTVEVVVNKPQHVAIEKSITAGDSYLFGGESYDKAGTYTHTFVSQATGCDSVVTLTLSLMGVDPTIINQGPFCEGDDIVLEAANAPNGSTFSWTGPNGFSSTSKKITLPNASEDMSGTYTLVMDVNGMASAPISSEVIVNTKQEITLTEEIDFGQYYMLGGEKLTESGTYTETFPSKVTGCDSTVTLHLSVKEFDPISIENNGPLCEGETLQFTTDNAADNVTFSWSGPNGFSSTEMEPRKNAVNIKDKGTYTLKVMVNNILAQTITTTVEINKIQESTQEVEIIFGETFQFDDEIIEKSGTYKKVYTGSNGCDSIAILNVKYGIQNYPELIPAEYISPNDDGTRDTWTIQNAEVFEKITVWIYDRFGKLLRKIEGYDNLDNVWDGKDSQGNDLPSSDYWYIIHAIESDKLYKGHVTLIR